MESINVFMRFFRPCLSCIFPSYYSSVDPATDLDDDVLINPCDDNSSLSSAASSATMISPDYDVFISHRGRDIKPSTGGLYDGQDPRGRPKVNATFETDLFDRLNACGFRVFLDRHEMQGGLYVDRQIKHAITTASIHIAIFSPAYAESPWCLDELHQMSEACKSDRAILIPVFYRVKPSEVRRPANGPYGEALCIHKGKQRFDSPTISGWEAALNHAGDTSGFELEAPNGSYDEGYKKLLNEVVGRVLEIGRTRSKYHTKSEIKKLLNGVVGRVLEIGRTPSKYLTKSQFQKTVGSSQGCIIVGIVGPGGVGKTQLVQDFFESNRSKYSGSCFLSDAKESSEISLLRRLIKDLTQLDVPIATIDEGKDVLKIGISRLNASSFRAFIVLDDADHANQMDWFWSIKKILGSNSLILVTSRHERVLIGAGIEETSIYCLTGFSTPSPKTNTKCRLGSDTLKNLPDASVLDPYGSLKELWLHDSPKLKCLSDSYRLLNRLTELNIVDCGIESLPITDMNNLEVLRVHNCRYLNELSFRTESRIICQRKARLLGDPMEPSPQDVPPKLKHLWINSCTTLLKVGPLPTTLIIVDLSYCNTLSEIEGLCYLERLQQLDISGCEKVEELPSLEKLKSLSSLKAYRCNKLKSIKGLASSKNLRRLYVCKCREMLQLLGVEDCKPLDELYARGCSGLQWTDVVLKQLRQRLKVVQVDDSSDYA